MTTVMSPTTVTIEIDGKAVSVAANSTILEAAQATGIRIPTLCYYPRLSVEASCRVCLVAVDGMRGLVPACATQVRDGMVMHTDTAEVLAARRISVELLLATHPMTCDGCDSDGRCELQTIAEELGLHRSFVIAGEPQPIDDRHPIIVRDPNKCIMCTRCVRACHEIAVNDVLGVVGRGIEARIGTFFDEPMETAGCASCGECVSVCPTGALWAKTDVKVPANAAVRVTRTVCPWCGVGCTLELHTVGNQIVKVTSPRDAPANQGSLCVKGRFGYSFVNHADRLTRPLIRIAPKGQADDNWRSQFREATWDEALEYVADRMTAIKDGHGAKALAGLSSAKTSNESNWVMQRFIREVLGSNNIDHCARL